MEPGLLLAVGLAGAFAGAVGLRGLGWLVTRRDVAEESSELRAELRAENRRLRRENDEWRERYFQAIAGRRQVPELPPPSEKLRFVVLDLGRLRETLSGRLSRAEVKRAAFDLDMTEPSEALDKPGQVQELLEALRHRRRLDNLLEWIAENRPDIEVES